ncbi:MAG: GntR family transcriptional regulator [Planctomycetota bacterium]
MSSTSTAFPFSTHLAGVRPQDGSGFAAGLRDLIRRGDVPIGERLPSERRLADELSLPRAVVRASLLELEREGLIECMRGSGRQVAQPHRRLGRGTIAVVIAAEITPGGPPKHPARSSYQAGVALGALQRREQPALIVHPRRLIDEGVDWLRRHNVMGVVVVQWNSDDFDLEPTLQDIREAGIDLVMYSSDDRPRPCDRVFSDHAAGAAMLTRWLVEQGRPRILRFWRMEAPRHWLNERDRGHEAELQRLGLEPLPAVSVISPIGCDISPAEPDSDYEPLIAMEMGYLYPYLCGGGQPRIDAIMTATDRHALEASDAVRRLGLEPGKDVAIVGYDQDHPLLIGDYPKAVPPNASVDRDNDRIGQAMSDMLLDRLAGKLPNEPQSVSIKPTLVVHTKA